MRGRALTALVVTAPSPRSVPPARVRRPLGVAAGATHPGCAARSLERDGAARVIASRAGVPRRSGRGGARAWRLTWAGLVALALVGGLAGEAAAARLLQRYDVAGELVTQPTGAATCPFGTNESWYYAAYTDSRYVVGAQAHFFLLLDGTELGPAAWLVDGLLSTWVRGLQVRPYCPTATPCACEGQVGSQIFAPVEVLGSQVWTSAAFTRLAGYDDYASRVQALGGTPVSPTAGYTQFGYAVVELSAAGGAHTATDVRGPLSGAGCGDSCSAQPYQWVAAPYETRKGYSGEYLWVVAEDWCGDGADGNGNGRVDETCWGAGLGAGGGGGASGGGGGGGDPCPHTTQEPVGSSCHVASGTLADTIPLLEFHGGPLPLDFRVSYNSLDAEAGRLGRGWVHRYGMRIRPESGRLSLMLVDATGGWTQYRRVGTTYVPLNRPVRDTITRLADGRYERRWPNGERWTFSAAGWLTELRDANGNAVRLTYTGDGTVLSRVEDPAGRTLTFTYDTSGRVTQVADSAGRSVGFVYSTGTPPQLVTIVEAAGGSWDFTHDAAGRLATKTNPRRHVVRYGYTAQGRLASVTDPANVTRSLTYDPAQRTTRILEPGGATRVHTWEGRIDAPVRVTDASGRTTTYGYFGTGRVASRTDGAGHTWRYAYDSLMRLVTVTDPLTRATRYTYAGDSDRIATRTEPDGALTQFVYDARGNLTRVIDPTNRETTFGYDARGNLTAITDPAGQTTTFTYDAQNFLVASTDPTGVTLSYGYDAVGRLASVTDAANATTSYTYDALNRLTTMVDPLTHATSTAYDPMGNRTSQTDALSRVTQVVYDARGLLTSTTDPAGGVTTSGYDSRRFLTSLTDAESRTTTWTHDAAGRVLTETDPLGRVTTHQYDARGLRQFTTTPRGETIESQYDPVGRLTARVLPGGVTESYAYDVTGRLQSATGGGVTSTWAYDAAGRVTSVTDSRGYVMSYTYDAAGRRATLTYPGGQVLTYGYDLAGRLTSLLDGARTITLAYDAVGRRATLTYANGTRTTYAYDPASRLTGLTHATSTGATLQSFTYGYDAADSRTSLATLTQGVTYGYDLANRLTSVAATPGTPIPSEGFTYDRVGNRLTGPDPADSYAYNAGHELLTGPGATYTHDLTGNRATKTDAAGTTTYTWDAVDRLVQAVVSTATGTTTVTYAYDALGRRVRKTVVETSGSSPITRTTEYVYDEEDILLAIETTDAGGTPTTRTTRYVHGPGIDEPLLVEDGGQAFAVHADALGSVTGLSDGSQTLVEASTYTSFGQLNRSGGVAGNGYAYTGREWEPEMELYYYRARYYDPEAGRFLSRDPIGFASGDTNLYGYVRADPHNFSDPRGLDRYEPCVACTNFIERFLCRRGVDRACQVSPQVCCKADAADCHAKANDPYEVWSCYIKEAHCNISAGLPPPPPPPMLAPPGAPEYPFPPATAGRTKKPDPRFEQLLNAEGEIR